MIHRNSQDSASLAHAISKRNLAAKAKREKCIAERVEDAWIEVSRLVNRFREEDPGLRRVIVFGSFGEGRVRRADFDIDLAYEGTRFIEALVIVLQSPFSVDLVDLTTVRSAFRDEIERYGKEVYNADEN
jgi:predicted nucleotidyltransferase